MSNIKNYTGKLYTLTALLFVSCLAITTMSCSHQQQDSQMQDKNVQALNCANQLKMFANAKQLWAEQNNKGPNDTPTMDEIAPFIRCNTNCPGGGTYNLGKVGETPTCSIPEHQAAFTKMLQEQSAAQTQ